MSRVMTLEISEEAFQAASQQAAAEGKTTSQWLAESVDRHFREMGCGPSSPPLQKPMPESRAAADARQRFERLLGAADLGYPTGIDNDGIDADLGLESIATHEGP